MSIGAALDVLIGLVFTYLMLGVLASGVQEAVAGFLELRGKDLELGIFKMLILGSNAAPDRTLFDKVFQHALVADPNLGKRPSYVPAANFALAVIESLQDGTQSPVFSQIATTVTALPPGPARQSLAALVNKAGGDVDVLRRGIETWFDDAMDRVSGDYKRRAHYFTLAFGFIIAIAFNVDTLNLARALWINPTLSAAVSASAQSYLTTPGNVPAAPAAGATQTPDDLMRSLQSNVGTVSQTLTNLTLPIGWVDSTGQGRSAWVVFADRFSTLSVIWALIGWIVTGVAVSLGAPFWFDTLQNLVNLRAAGPKPARRRHRPEHAGPAGRQRISRSSTMPRRGAKR